jgi:hypothetical protein
MNWETSARTARESRSSPMSQATSIVFVVDDDISVRESLELLIRCAGWQPEIIRVRAGIPCPPTSACSELPRTGRFSSGPQWSRSAEAHRCGSD